MKIGGTDRPTLRDEVIRCNEQRPDSLVNESSPGAPGKLTDRHKAFLAHPVEEGLIPGHAHRLTQEDHLHRARRLG